MASSVGFEFPSDVSGQWDGFNEPGIKHFTGSPLEHLGREVPQNTIDAMVVSPAKIRISLVSVPTSSLPGIVELRDAVSRCTEEAKNESDKATAFFANASKLLSAKNMSVLQIADYNTSGITGPCVNGMPFFAMMKATGQSKKAGTSTGSFGIGKLAPFTVSELRSVFVTSVWSGDDGLHHYTQGKSILMSFKDPKEMTRRGTGFWGTRKNCMPLETIDGLPDWLRRSNPDGSLIGHVGTTLSILGFSGSKNWQKALAANIAESFFGALHEGQLEVEIDGGPSVNSKTVGPILNSPDIQASIKNQKGGPDKFANARFYLDAISDKLEVKTEETEDLHLGKCRLKILVGDGLPKKVAVLRNGMLITDELANLRRFSVYKEFVAVLECRSEKGLKLLRAMEPPRHDDFEPDRLSPDQRHTGRVALKDITYWVRSMLDRHAKDPISEETSLDEMADFFSVDDEAGTAKKSDENPTGNIVFRQRPVKFKSRPLAFDGSGSGSPSDDDDQADDESPADGAKPGTGAGATTGKAQKSKDGGKTGTKGAEKGSANVGKRTTASGVPLKNVRAVLTGPCERRVGFTPSITGTIQIELQASGADFNDFIEIALSDTGSVVEGRIRDVDAVAGERVIIDVKLAADFEGTVRVVANAV